MSDYHWNWLVLFNQVEGTNEYYYQWILAGLGWTVACSLLAWSFALILGIVIGTLRTVPNKWLSGFATAYVELFRNIPLIVQLFLWVFVLPQLLPQPLAGWMQQSVFIMAVLGLSLFTGARVAEQVRTGILALSNGQQSAALALGFTRAQTYRYVLLPVAMRIILPPLTSEFMSVFKNSAVAQVVSLAELTFQMRHMISEYTAGNPIEVMTVVSVLYLILAYAVNLLMKAIEHRVQVPGTSYKKTDKGKKAIHVGT